MSLAYDMMEQIATYRIMNAIAVDNEFRYGNVFLTVKELEKRKKFEITYNFTFAGEDMTQTCIEEPDNENDIREFVNMRKHPQNIYAAIIFKKQKDEDYLDSEVITVYEKGSEAKAVYELTELIIEEFIKYKEMTSVKEMAKYVKKVENAVETMNLGLNELASKLHTNKPKYIF